MDGRVIRCGHFAVALVVVTGFMGVIAVASFVATLRGSLWASVSAFVAGAAVVHLLGLRRRNAVVIGSDALMLRSGEVAAEVRPDSASFSFPPARRSWNPGNLQVTIESEDTTCWLVSEGWFRTPAKLDELRAAIQRLGFEHHQR